MALRTIVTLPLALETALSQYDAVMIDQPEIFIATDSPYRGAKPKHLDVLAEALRVGIARALSEDLYVVDQAGENVLYLSVPVSNFKLTKKKKKAFQYLPVALVVSGVKKRPQQTLRKWQT